MTTTAPRDAWPILFAAFVTALFASLAVLFVGEVMGQAPCNLCWFQRAFMFPLAIVLGLAALRSDISVTPYGITLAACGWVIAAFHSLLYVGIIPEAIKPCSAGPSCSGSDMTVLGNLPLPVLSLAAFTLIIICLLRAPWRTQE